MGDVRGLVAELAESKERERIDWWAKPGFREYAQNYAELLQREAERKSLYRRRRPGSFVALAHGGGE